MGTPTRAARCMPTDWVRGLPADPFCSYQDHAKLDFASVATDAPLARSASLSLTHSSRFAT